MYLRCVNSNCTNKEKYISAIRLMFILDIIIIVHYLQIVVMGKCTIEMKIELR